MPVMFVAKAPLGWKTWNAAARRCSKAVVLPTFLRIAVLLFAGAILSNADAKEDVSPRGNPLWGISLNNLRATAERPLFSPSRRPPPPPLAAPPIVTSPLPPPRPVEPERPPLTLLGTIIGERVKIAVLLEETTKDTVRLKVGEIRGGWILRTVHARTVDFERNHRIATLSFQRDADDQPPTKLPVDVAASNNPDMESYRAALHRSRGR
jgi:hypothetical protein